MRNNTDLACRCAGSIERNILMRAGNLFFPIAAILFASLLVAGCSSPTFLSPEGGNIICFGDSLTYGTGAPTGKSYPDQLAAMTGQPVINAGVPGDTTAGALERLDRDVLSRSPRIVLITLGGNDLRRGIDKSVAFRNLKTIVAAIQAEGALVVIGGLKFMLLDRGYGSEYEKLAENTGALLVTDLLGGLLGNKSLMHDTIHPNGEGYRVMARKFYQSIEAFL
jgi:lysophospholipase L1-like esterase